MGYLVSRRLLPSWFRYPPQYLRVVGQGLIDLTPWHCLQAEDVVRQMRGLEKRYPSRRLVPFARRQDNDDVACWEEGKPDSVVIVHDHASEGWEGEGGFPSLWAWFWADVEDMVDWDDPRE